jgi:hypothetical protein
MAGFLLLPTNPMKSRLLFLILGISSLAWGEASLTVPPKFQGFNSNGTQCASCKLYSYTAGTLTPLATYTTQAGDVANANPVVLNARGEANVWQTNGSTYNLVLNTSADVEIWSVDNIRGGVPASIVTKNISDVRFADAFDGADYCAKVVAAIADLPNTGGTVDARGLEGAQTCAANPLGVSKPVKLIIGASTITTSATWALGSNVTIECMSWSSEIKLANSQNSYYVITNADPSGGNSNIQIRNCKIDGNKANQSPTGAQRTGGIYFQKVTDFLIEDVEVANPYHHGMQFLNSCTRGRIVRPYVHDNTNGSGIIGGNGDGASSSTVSDFQIAQPIIRNIAVGNGIFFIGHTSAGQYGTSDISISDPNIDVPSGGDTGIEIGVSVQRATISGGVITVAGTVTTGILARSAKDVSVYGTQVISADAGNTQIGVYAWNDTGDNTVFATVGFYGLTVRGFTGTSASGIAWSSVSASSDNLAVVGNIATGNTTNFDARTTNITNLVRFANSDGLFNSDSTKPFTLNVLGSGALANPLITRTGGPGLLFKDPGVSVSAGGLWRFVTSSGSVLLNMNTAAGGDFSTSNSAVSIDTSQNVLLPTSLKVGGSGTALTQYRVYSQAIDVASVAANTSAEQTFTVTGVTTADKCFANKPSLTAGIVIGNCRVSATDTVAITFGNLTAGAIDPASETYNIVTFRN